MTKDVVFKIAKCCYKGFYSKAISKTGNGESGNGNGERGMGMGNLLKWGISKRGNY